MRLMEVKLYIMIHISDAENLDVIFLFYMKSVIRKLKYGIEGLKADIQNVDENVVSYISKGLDLIRSGYTPKEIDFLLEYELLKFINDKIKSNPVIFQLTLSKRLLVLLQNEDMASFLDLENLFGPESRKYFCMTFIPNLPKEIRLNYQLDFYIENIPKDKLELNNY